MQPPPTAAPPLKPRVEDTVSWTIPPPSIEDPMAAGAPAEDHTVKIQLAQANQTSTLTSATSRKPSTSTAAAIAKALSRQILCQQRPWGGEKHLGLHRMQQRQVKTRGASVPSAHSLARTYNDTLMRNTLNPSRLRGKKCLWFADTTS